MKDPSRNVSSSVIKDEDEYFPLANIITGATQSDCRLPCTTIKTETKHIQQVGFEHNSMLDLVPSERIDVTETKFVTKTLAQYMSELVSYISYLTILQSYKCVFFIHLSFKQSA